MDSLTFSWFNFYYLYCFVYEWMISIVQTNYKRTNKWNLFFSFQTVTNAFIYSSDFIALLSIRNWFSPRNSHRTSASFPCHSLFFSENTWDIAHMNNLNFNIWMNKYTIFKKKTTTDHWKLLHINLILSSFFIHNATFTSMLSLRITDNKFQFIYISSKH